MESDAARLANIFKPSFGRDLHASYGEVKASQAAQERPRSANSETRTGARRATPGLRGGATRSRNAHRHAPKKAHCVRLRYESKASRRPLMTTTMPGEAAADPCSYAIAERRNSCASLRTWIQVHCRPGRYPCSFPCCCSITRQPLPMRDAANLAGLVPRRHDAEVDYV